MATDIPRIILHAVKNAAIKAGRLAKAGGIWFWNRITEKDLVQRQKERVKEEKLKVMEAHAKKGREALAHELYGIHSRMEPLPRAMAEYRKQGNEAAYQQAYEQYHKLDLKAREIKQILSRPGWR